MKQVILLGSLLALLAACDSTTSAYHDCNRLNYAKGTPEYQHCVVDMKAAEKLEQQNNANMK